MAMNIFVSDEPVTCRRKHKLSFSYVQKDEKMGKFNLEQKTFICDNWLTSYARLNALNTENVNARNPGSKFSFTIIEMITCF